MTDPAAHLAPTSIDLDDAETSSYWRERFGITLEQLQESVLAAGTDPKAVEEHLLQQGSSAGAG